MCFSKWVDKCGGALYFLFRIIVGAFIFFHGLGKLVPGFLGPGDIVKFAGMLTWGLTWVAVLVAVGEMLVGLGLFFGFLTRLAALGGIVIALGAILLIHTGLGHGQFNPNMLANGSELVWLYLAAYFAIFVNGAGKWSLEKGLLKREKELLW